MTGGGLALLEGRVAAAADHLISICKSKQLTISAAESLTGGLIADALVSVPGTSAVFQASVVCYSDQAKIDLLGVPEETIEEFGAVSAATAQAMALGSLGVAPALGRRIAVAATGVAGPDLQEGKPVGTVFIAVASELGFETRQHSFVGDRAEVRAASALAALEAALGCAESFAN